VFNLCKIARGLDDIRELYGTRGYVNLATVLEVVSNESRGTIDLLIDVEEGQPYDFGKLYLEAVEPYPGAAQTLLKSGEPPPRQTIQLELRRWFAENKSHWKVAPLWRSVNLMPPDPEHRVVNVTLPRWDP
jgi:hypothetical protein